MEVGRSGMTVLTSRISNPSLFPYRHYVIACRRLDDRSHFKKLANEAGMLLKTKDSRGGLGNEAGMSMKIKTLSH
jgi:hypothetical protein